MKTKDLIGIAVLSVCVFPILLIGVLLGTGTIRLEVGTGTAEKKIKPYLKKFSPQKQSEEISQMKSYQALQNKEKELEGKENRLRRQSEHLENLKMELNRTKDDIQKNRIKIEELVAVSGEMEQKKMIALAEIYGSMRPEEAAPILLTMKDELVAEILMLVPETRSQSKIMGAIGLMDVNRAAKISRLMGKQDI